MDVNTIERMDILLVNFSKGIGSEQNGTRYCVVVSNNMGIVVRREDTWKHIDDLKAQGKLFYVTTIRTLKVTDVFFKLNW